MESQKSSQAPCRPIYVQLVSSHRRNKHQRLPSPPDKPSVLSKQVPKSRRTTTVGEPEDPEEPRAVAPPTQGALRIPLPTPSPMKLLASASPPQSSVSPVPSFSSTTPVSSLTDLILMFSSFQRSQAKNAFCPQREGVGKLI